MARKFASFFALLLLFNACCPLTSKHPLSGTDNSVYDQRLAGIWKSDDGEIYMHIGKGEGNRVKVVAVEHGANAKVDTAVFSVLTTPVKQENYLSIDLAALSKDITSNHKGYILVRYDFPDRDSITFQPLSADALALAIQSKRLAGEISYRDEEGQPQKPTSGAQAKRRIECVRITDSPENIRAFLAAEDRGKNLFDDPITLKRIQ